MTTLREAAMLALEALENSSPDQYPEDAGVFYDAKDALRAALEQPEPDAIEQALAHTEAFSRGHDAGWQSAIAHRAALEQPVQEPVAWMFQHDETGRINFVVNYGMMAADEFIKVNPRYTLIGSLYTHPPRREWRGLKEWEINDGLDQLPTEDVCSWSFRKGVYFAEAALRSKNHE
jgi:hypothetical protein